MLLDISRWLRLRRFVLHPFEFFAARDDSAVTLAPEGRQIVAQCVSTGNGVKDRRAPERGGRTGDECFFRPPGFGNTFWLRLCRLVLHLFKFVAAREDFTALVERASKPATPTFLSALRAAHPFCLPLRHSVGRPILAAAAFRRLLRAFPSANSTEPVQAPRAEPATASLTIPLEAPCRRTVCRGRLHRRPLCPGILGRRRRLSCPLHPLPRLRQRGQQPQHFGQRLVGLLEIRFQQPPLHVIVQLCQPPADLAPAIVIERRHQFLQNAECLGDRTRPRRDLSRRQIPPRFPHRLYRGLVQQMYQFQRIRREHPVFQICVVRVLPHSRSPHSLSSATLAASLRLSHCPSSNSPPAATRNPAGSAKPRPWSYD